MTKSEFERRIEAFERAWRDGSPPSIAASLPEGPCDPGGGARLVLELIAVDLECRWLHAVKAVPRRQLGDYRHLFPETSLAEWPIDLIGQEYRVRRQAGEAIDHLEYLARFPRHRDTLPAELARIDRELLREADPIRQPNQSPSPRDWPLAHDAFHLLRMVGSGRTGKVFEAIDRGSNLRVAVKYLRKGLTNNPRFIERFLVEAQVVEGLEHPGIVKTLGRGCTPAGSVFLVLEWVAGPNLETVRRTRDIAWREAIAWGIAISDALVLAHERGVIHCDLKPGNLLLDRDGRIRLTDFGLARSRGHSPAWTADIEGTAPFMAPEQVSGRFGIIGPRTDIYGLGAVLYCLIAGRPPHHGHDVGAILGRVASPDEVEWPARVEGVPAAAREVILRCVRKRPEDRMGSMRMLHDALISLQT